MVAGRKGNGRLGNSLLNRRLSRKVNCTYCTGVFQRVESKPTWAEESKISIPERKQTGRKWECC